MRPQPLVKTTRSVILALFAFLLVAGSNLAAAVSHKLWKSVHPFGSTKSDIRKALGKPDDADGMDTYLISDSPEFMMMGLIGYENGRVAAVSTVLQPTLTYKKIRDVQLQSDEVKFVSEDKNGVLFKYRNPIPNGPRFIVVSPSDDRRTGPMIVYSIANPLAAAAPGKPAAKPAPPPSKVPPQPKPQVDWSLLDKDIFDWELLDERAKLAMLNKIKALWRATGAETDKNAIDARILLQKIRFPEQSLVFDQACEAAGINPIPIQKLRSNRPKAPN